MVVRLWREFAEQKKMRRDFPLFVVSVFTLNQLVLAVGVWVAV